MTTNHETTFTEAPQTSIDLVDDESSWDSSGQLVDSLAQEPDFIESLHAKGGDTGVHTLKYAEHLAEYTGDFIEARMQDGTETPETLEKMLLIADAGPLFHAQYRLEQEKLDHKEERELKTLASEYNGRLYKYMGAHPEAKFSDMTESIYKHTRHMFPRREEFVEKSIEQIARGARAEKGFKDVATQLGFGTIEGSTNEDLRGIDFFVQIPNPATGEIAKVLKVDVKSALTKVDSNNNGSDGTAYSIGKGGNVILWPGFDDNDFDNNFTFRDDPARMNQILDFNAMQLFMASREPGV